MNQFLSCSFHIDFVFALGILAEISLLVFVVICLYKLAWFIVDMIGHRG